MQTLFRPIGAAAAGILRCIQRYSRLGDEAIILDDTTLAVATLTTLNDYTTAANGTVGTLWYAISDIYCL